MSIANKIKVGLLGGFLTAYALTAIALTLAVPVGVVLIAYHLLTQ